MKAERGYFSTDLKGDVHWVASEEGAWLLSPEIGLREMTDEEIMKGIDPGDTGITIKKTIQNEK